MAKSRSFEINSEKYIAKTLAEKVKQIKSELEDGVVVTHGDHRFEFMLELYHRYYPFQEDKGVDIHTIRDLTVIRNENCQYRSQTFFWVLHNDEMINWQPKDCWSPKSHLTCVKNAFRMAISGQTYQELTNLINDAKGRMVVCDITGEPFYPDRMGSCEVDHRDPEFDMIFWAFLGKKEISTSSIEYYRDNGCWLSDKELEKEFQDFHKEHANMRVVSKQGHKLKTYGKKNKAEYKFIEFNLFTGVACGQ